jgi:DNA-binding HxlR family transcriptional regulator
MSEAFSNELKQFIAQHVESLAQMEALLILRQNGEQRWRSAELAQRLYITPDMCEAILADLERRGFAARASDGAYFYQPRDRAVDKLIDDLATIYQQRRVAVITEIYSKPVTKVQTFADAFRLRREEP